MSEVLAAVEQSGVDTDPLPEPGSLEARRRDRERVRRTEALSLRLAGLTYAQISERMRISHDAAEDMVDRVLGEVRDRGVAELRELEGARLDRAQAAIWTQVLEGDLKAVDTFLRLSSRRAKMFGLDAPTKIDLSLNVRAEMEHALAQLEAVVMGEVVSVTDVPLPRYPETHAQQYDPSHAAPATGPAASGSGPSSSSPDHDDAQFAG